MYRWIASLAVVLPMLAAAISGAQAQNQSSGLFGNRTLGSSLQAGNRTFGGSQRGSLGQGNAASSGNATAGQVTGGERFVRGNRGAGEFVGRDTADTRAFRSQSGNQLGGGQFGSALGSGAGGLGDFNSAARRFSQPGGNNDTPRAPVRIRYRVGFEYTRPTETKLAANLTERFAKTLRLPSGATPHVVMVAGTAVLEGVVATERDRELAAILASLEPGVAQVQNDLRVAAEVNTPQPVSPPSPEPDQQ